MAGRHNLVRSRAETVSIARFASDKPFAVISCDSVSDEILEALMFRAVHVQTDEDSFQEAGSADLASPNRSKKDWMVQGWCAAIRFYFLFSHVAQLRAFEGGYDGRPRGNGCWKAP